MGDEFHYIFECSRFVNEESLIYKLNKETDMCYDQMKNKKYYPVGAVPQSNRKTVEIGTNWYP